MVLYQETRKPVDGKPAKPRWTWKFSEEKEAAWREEIKLAIRQKRDGELTQIMNRLYKSPGFHGVRKQIGKIRSFLTAEWRRSRAKGEKLPPLPTQLSYARRLRTTGLPIAQLVNDEATLLKPQIAVEQAGKMTENRSIPPG